MQALVERNMKMSSDAGSRYKWKPTILEVTLNDQINYTSISIWISVGYKIRGRVISEDEQK